MSLKKIPSSPLMWASVDYIRDVINDDPGALNRMATASIIKSLFGVAGDDLPSIYAMTDGVIKSAGPQNMQAILKSLTDQSETGPIWVYTTNFGLDVVLNKSRQEDGTNAIELVMYLQLTNPSRVQKRRLVTYSASMQPRFGFCDEISSTPVESVFEATRHQFIEVKDEEEHAPETPAPAEAPEVVEPPAETPAAPEPPPVAEPEAVPEPSDSEGAPEVQKPAEPVAPVDVKFVDTDLLTVREANNMLTAVNGLIEAKETSLEAYKAACLDCIRPKNRGKFSVQIKFTDDPKPTVVVTAATIGELPEVTPVPEIPPEEPPVAVDEPPVKPSPLYNIFVVGTDDVKYAAEVKAFIEMRINPDVPPDQQQMMQEASAEFKRQVTVGVTKDDIIVTLGVTDKEKEKLEEIMEEAADSHSIEEEPVKEEQPETTQFEIPKEQLPETPEWCVNGHLTLVLPFERGENDDLLTRISDAVNKNICFPYRDAEVVIHQAILEYLKDIDDQDDWSEDYEIEVKGLLQNPDTQMWQYSVKLTDVRPGFAEETVPAPEEEPPAPPAAAKPAIDLDSPETKRAVINSLFPNVLDPSYNHVKTFLSDYLTENGDASFLATKTIPTEVTIRWDNVTIAFVKMFDGKAYRIYAALTDLGLQKHDWVSTSQMEGRWHQICPEICLPNFGNGGFRHGQRFNRRH